MLSLCRPLPALQRFSAGCLPSKQPDLVSRASSLRHHYATAAASVVSPEYRRLIAVKIRKCLEQGRHVKWNALEAEYGLPREELRRIAAQDSIVRRRRPELAVQISRLADEAYDSVRGRTDWEAVATKAGLPLVECLQHFNTATSSHTVRSLPGLADWSVEDLLVLRRVVASIPAMPSEEAWVLLAVYMNVGPSDCRRILGSTKCRYMTPEIHALIRKHREDGWTWDRIQRRFPIFANLQGLHQSYKRHAARKAVVTDVRPERHAWSTAETEYVNRSIDQYYLPGSCKFVEDVIARKYPYIDKRKIINKIIKLLEAKRAVVARDIGGLKKLVDKRGDDWEQIGWELGTAPNIVKSVWLIVAVSLQAAGVRHI